MPRTIDGFMPRTTTARLHLAPRTAAGPPQRQPTADRQPAQRLGRPATPVPAIPRRAFATPATPTKRRRGIPERLQMPLIIAGAMLAGMFAQSAILGEVLVAAYGIAALVWHIASRTTFTLALLALVATTLLLVVRGNVALAQNFATYTFLLLVVGVITLIGELKKEGGRVYSNRKNIT